MISSEVFSVYTGETLFTQKETHSYSPSNQRYFAATNCNINDDLSCQNFVSHQSKGDVILS